MEQFISPNKDGKDNNSPPKDKLFDPSIDMLVNDFDDERTLEEEEALAAGESQDADAELSTLQKEGDMPLEQLLALYGFQGENQENEDPEQRPEADQPVEGDQPTEDDQPVEEEEEQEVEENSSQMSEPAEELDSVPSPPEPSKLCVLYEPMPDDQDDPRLLRSVSSRVSEEEDEDYDYSPDEEDWRKVNKTIMVGSDYQAQIPEGLSHYDDALPYENDDKLLWDPNDTHLEGIDVSDFLRKVSSIRTSKTGLPQGVNLRDDEEALYMLQQCGHNVEEALRRLKMAAPAVAPEKKKKESLWSEEECKNFEAGVRAYGKNFHRIQQEKVRTRSVGELVQFYYLWKKSERHDIFANRTRLEKKKYVLHPGITDFMDRFLEDQDSRDRSDSPPTPACSTSAAVRQPPPPPPPDT
ncbi:mesoderm induction early response protein 1-like isoform X3 [Diabrotica virgifera virgifera]|uniref:Mesoderm induction early response protein 1 n=1 Tax=Diabrotica virgifera virgifera TaxID=50390 RepID=A0ABM5JHD7_DIAVI|nr:mesoderm induction early response protein 1-like isoform X3 [Diabrotica virgifera virgifera]